jgi:hypothetical protein
MRNIPLRIQDLWFQIPIFCNRQNHDKQTYTLQEHLEEWRREVRCSGDRHREYPIIGSISWEFLIDPVTNSPESECYGYDDGERIYERPELIGISFCEEIYSEYHPEESSMETHPSFPDLDYIKRIFNIV